MCDEVRFSLPHSLMASVLAQNSHFDKKAIGVHFDTHLTFSTIIKKIYNCSSSKSI